MASPCQAGRHAPRAATLIRGHGPSWPVGASALAALGLLLVAQAAQSGGAAAAGDENEGGEENEAMRESIARGQDDASRSSNGSPHHAVGFEHHGDDDLDDEGRCAVPTPVLVEARPAGCGPEDGDSCRWRVPTPRAGDPYELWRNTNGDSLWGRPGLVGAVLGAAHGMARLYPGEPVVVGDLDAPGPRHETHRTGQDVDLYLPGAMLEENLPGTATRSNYQHRSPLEVRMLRGRVQDLAKVLALCARGRLSILYNDPVVRDRFEGWLGRTDRALWAAPSARPRMRPHNALHRFHFHVRVAPDVRPPDGIHPTPTRDPDG